MDEYTVDACGLYSAPDVGNIEDFYSGMMPLEEMYTDVAGAGWQWWSDEPEEGAWALPVLQDAWQWNQYDQVDQYVQAEEADEPAPPTQQETRTSEMRSDLSETRGRDAERGQDDASRPSSGPSSVILRGLPFNATECEIKAFIKRQGVSQKDVAKDGVALLANTQGRPSGFAEITLAPGADFWAVRELLHMQRIGSRYIEVLPPRQSRKRNSGGGQRRGQKAWKRG